MFINLFYTTNYHQSFHLYNPFFGTNIPCYIKKSFIITIEIFEENGVLNITNIPFIMVKIFKSLEQTMLYMVIKTHYLNDIKLNNSRNIELYYNIIYTQ